MYAVVSEELGRVSGGIGLSFAAHTSLGAKPIELFGTDAQKLEWLRPLAEGKGLGAWALTEPGSGSDASNMETTAKYDVDTDEYVLNGTKQFITNANVADSVLVKAVTDPEAGYDGISTFIVDPDADDGFEVTTVLDKIGLNCSPTCEIGLDDVRIPANSTCDRCERDSQTQGMAGSNPCARLSEAKEGVRRDSRERRGRAGVSRARD